MGAARVIVGSLVATIGAVGGYVSLSKKSTFVPPQFKEAQQGIFIYLEPSSRLIN
jgi:hypothetical protein